MLIVVPLLALLFLVFAPPPAHPPRLSRFLVPALGILVLWWIGVGLMPDRILYPELRGTRVLQYVLNHYRARPDPRAPILILEGSSLTFYGLNGRYLEKFLAEKFGLSCTVLQFSSPGANHYERRKMFLEFFSALSAREREEFRNAPVVLLREVFREYDANPLKFLEGDDLRRNVFYTDWQSFGLAWRTSAILPQGARLRWNLLKATVLHEFGSGAFWTFRIPGEVSPAPPFTPLYNVDPPKFDFDKVWKEFSSRYLEGERRRLPEGEVPFDSWRFATADLLEVVSPEVDRIGYFAPPVLSVEDFAYQLAFLDSLPPDTLVFGPPGVEVFRQLNTPEQWFDPHHISEKGVTVATVWLSAELAARWSQLFPD